MPSDTDKIAAPNDKMGTKKGEKRQEKSYLASAVESINPWTITRSVTPTPKDRSSSPQPKAPPPAGQKADDHSTNTLYGISFKKYPADCPPLNVMWFHAVDIPKRKPQFLRTKKKEPDNSRPVAPKKFAAFSNVDSRSLENTYQRLLEETEHDRRKGGHARTRSSSNRSRGVSIESPPNTAFDRDAGDLPPGSRVPVNEDFLFDVNIEHRELAPVYWLGPIYEVRRGTWFYQEGSSLRPCEENLAAQLEEGYLKTKPWTYPASRTRSDSGAPNITPKVSTDNLKATAKSQAEASLTPLPSQPVTPHQPQTYRLFGTYMNSVATYQDLNTAWLSSDGVFNWVTSTVYQRFAGGGYMNGVKLVRGYSEPGKVKDNKRPPTPTTATLPPQPTGDDDQDKQEKALKRRSAPPATHSGITGNDKDPTSVEIETRENQLERQFSSYMEGVADPEKQEEHIRMREEQEIQDDYTGQDGETQGRDIEHLVLVTHGIGQLLSLRMESVNFVHDVNMLRKSLKGVYAHSEDLKALNSEIGDGPGNCKIQVLPVCWRHLLDFPKRREKRGETDLGDVTEEEDEYPSLEDITVEGMAFARSLISDLALDVLLYQSAYREQITEIVLKESNRIYCLFLERNPEFKGKVHIIGHSLGSAIMFDILCRQKQAVNTNVEPLRNPLRFWPSQDHPEPSKDHKDLSFNFDVEDLYCLGSPVGLFQMLKGRTIAARHQPNAAPSESPLNTEYVDDPFLSTSSTPGQQISTITGLPLSVSSPKVAQLFNIFHPSDPIAYRLEPLVSHAMSSLKPQALPYTKRGIFGAVAPQGLSGIGVKVGQSVSGLWSSFSAGIASSLLNRSLGLSNEDIANFNAANPPANASSVSSTSQAAAYSQINGSSTVASNPSAHSEKTDARKKALARQNTSGSTSGGSNTPGTGNTKDSTLIDEDLETLYARFQKKRVEEHKHNTTRTVESRELSEAWAAEELKAHKLRREELKVRALNWNGRIDYTIQESALDFNPINTIASHMSYWQDEDVSHFLCSQLLCNRDARSRMYQSRQNTPSRFS